MDGEIFRNNTKTKNNFKITAKIHAHKTAINTARYIILQQLRMSVPGCDRIKDTATISCNRMDIVPN
jgi:hypothetical protein